MTAIKPNALLGAENDLTNAVSLIHSVYGVIYVCTHDDGPSLLGALTAGARLLRGVHTRLCDAIDEEGLDYTEAKVNGLPRQSAAVLEQLDIANVSIRAAILNPFLMAIDEVRQEAAVEQIRSAALILKNVIDHIENPT